MARLDRAFDDLRTFAADASHQLQTPLAVIKGTIDLLRRERVRVRQRAVDRRHVVIHHRQREVGGLAGGHPSQQDRHRPGGRLVVGDFPASEAAHEEIDFFLR